MAITKNEKSSHSPISRAGEKSKSKINLKVLIIFTSVLFLGIPFFISFFLFNTDISSVDGLQKVHIILKKDNKQYVFHDNEFFLENDLENGSVPAHFGNNQNLLVVDNEFFMEPLGIQAIAAIVAENYKFIPHKESNYDGYVVIDNPQLFEMKAQSKAGDKIGDVDYFYNLILRKNNANSDSLVISWQQTPVLSAINNCEEKNTMFYTSPYQGKTVGSSRNIVVVNLNLLTQFYQNNSFKITYDKTEQILYLTL